MAGGPTVVGFVVMPPQARVTQMFVEVPVAIPVPQKVRVTQMFMEVVVRQ